MEREHVKEKASLSTSDLIIISPSECMELGLFKNASNIETSENIGISIANLKQQLKHEITAGVSKSIQECEIHDKLNKDTSLNVFNSEVKPVQRHMYPTVLENPKKGIKENDDKQVITNNKKSADIKKMHELSSKISSSNLGLQNCLSNTKAKHAAVNSTNFACPANTYKTEIIARQNATNKNPVTVLDSQMTIDLTEPNKGLNERKLEKKKYINNNVKIPTKSNPFLLNIALQSDDTINQGFAITKNKVNNCGTEQDEECTISKIGNSEEASKKETSTSELMKIIDTQDNFETGNKLKNKRKVNIISNTVISPSSKEVIKFCREARIASKTFKNMPLTKNSGKELILFQTAVDKEDTLKKKIGLEHNAEVTAMETVTLRSIISKQEAISSIVSEESQTIDASKKNAKNLKNTKDEQQSTDANANRSTVANLINNTFSQSTEEPKDTCLEVVNKHSDDQLRVNLEAREENQEKTKGTVKKQKLQDREDQASIRQTCYMQPQDVQSNVNNKNKNTQIVRSPGIEMKHQNIEKDVENSLCGNSDMSGTNPETIYSIEKNNQCHKKAIANNNQLDDSKMTNKEKQVVIGINNELTISTPARHEEQHIKHTKMKFENKSLTSDLENPTTEDEKLNFVEDHTKQNEASTNNSDSSILRSKNNKINLNKNAPSESVTVPKKRGRKRKIAVDKKSENADKSKTDVEENVSNIQDCDTDSVNKQNEMVNVDHSLSECPVDDLNTKSVEKENENLCSDQELLRNTTIDVDPSKDTVSNVKTDKPLPKKRGRGRPRKNPDLTNTPESVESPSAQMPNKDEMVTSTPVPKKRCQKRKDAIANDTVEESCQPIETSASDQPLGKRKRKKINYFEMEHNMMLDDFIERQELCRTFSEDTFKFTPKKLKTYSRKERIPTSTITSMEKNSRNCVEELDECDSAEKSTAKLNEESFTAQQTEQTDNVKQENSDTIMSDDDTTEKKSKSKRTGGTVLMMKSIFSAAIKNSSLGNVGAEENISSETGSLNVKCTKPGRGRMKKSGKAEMIVIDEDNKVTCTSCNKKVDNDQWDVHNQNEHYNLGWREGDQPLDLDDSKFVWQTLKPILRQNKVLKCRKCQRTETTIEEFMSHMEECGGIVSSGGLITCAVCKQEMERIKWSLHKQRQHNNLAWRTGDPPLDLNNQTLVVSTLNALYKAKKPLHCEKCGAKKKSVVGFLSHQSQCGIDTADAKVKCEFCERRVLPVSMQAHIKLVHEAPKVKDIVGDKSDYFNIDLNALSSKRKAAETAMLIIDKFAKQKGVQEYTKYYVTELDFSEEDFVISVLKKELAEHQLIKCKFKDCTFEGDEIKTLLDHMNLCEKKPEQYYTCKRCLLVSNTQNEIEEHIKIVHNKNITGDNFEADCDELSDDDFDEDGDSLNREFKRRMLLEKKKMERDINYKIKPACIFAFVKKYQRLFSHAHQFTLEFCHTHFSTPLLFDNLRYEEDDWIPLDADLVEEYVPRYGESCDIARTVSTSFGSVLESDYTFKRIELFEGDCSEGEATIFCGGPVYAMAWLPTPHTSLNSRQILAVATTNNFDETYRVNENYNVSSLIQFWDFDVLQNKHDMKVPKLMLSLAFDFGPVWYLEWCPSGCFDDEKVDPNDGKMLRMGLLAVAGSNSVVYIYSIPSLKEEEMGAIYKVDPLLKLKLGLYDNDLLGNEKFYATRISWSMASGHKYMAVGYTNGMVGLFNIETTSRLLRHVDKDNIYMLLPYDVFQAHTHYISALTLIPQGGGKRWLFTASFDRDTFIWDLSNHTKISSSKKHVITDGVWLTNWLAYVTAADESSTNYGPVHACIKSYRDYMYEHVHLTSSPTTIMSLSASSWLNSIIQCSSVGDISAIFPNQLLYSLDNERTLKACKYLFGCTKLIDKSKTPAERVAEYAEKQNALRPDFTKKEGVESSSNSQDTENPIFNKYEPITYDEATEKYALLFCDRKMDTFHDFEKGTPDAADPCLKLEELEYSQPNIYNLQTINKIAYNPNKQASLYYATGYQAGFVRLTYIKFLEDDPQIV